MRLEMSYPLNILIVDNYDSFTYNLVHKFRELVDGVGSVTVVENDDSGFLISADFTFFDLIVLSPGPGHPSLDCGVVTSKVLDFYFENAETSSLPVLFGVCMGFEAIALRCGASVVPGVPRHGQRWLMTQTTSGDPLFVALPSEFSQVRYHSLVIDGLDKTDLVVTSTAMDDVHTVSSSNAVPCVQSPPDTPPWLETLRKGCFQVANRILKKTRIPMSFRHRTKPVWGVQYHPESILSQPWGFIILENICRIANTHETHRGVLSKKSCDKSSSDTEISKIKSLSILKNLFSKNLQDVYERYFLSDTSIWLDAPPGSSGQWSFMASFGPRSAIFEQKNGIVSLIQGVDDYGLLTGMDIFQCMDMIELDINQRFESSGTTLSPIQVPAIFPILTYEGDGSILFVSDRVLAIDTHTGEWYCMCLDGDSWSSDIWATTSLSGKTNEIQKSLLFKISDSKECYLEKIRAAQSAINLGESYEICLTTKISSDCSLQDFSIYKELRRLNPAQHACFFQMPRKISILSASPELFLRIEKGICRVKPIKGTRPRGSTISDDAELISSLGSSEKDISENLMIVDLVRNDLSKSNCTNVNCPNLMKVETYPPYHQLVSTVEGIACEGSTLTSTVFTLFPAGSMTGAPKKRSMQILAALESGPRGIYSGAIGYFSPLTGRVDLAVTIRTIEIDANSVSLGCGGAILSISDPEEEWREMLLKARTSLQVIANATSRNILLGGVHGDRKMWIRPLESVSVFTTMRYERGRGIWLGKRHLNRLKFEEAQLGKFLSNTSPSLGDYTCFTPLTYGPFDPDILEKEWMIFELPDPQIEGARIRVGQDSTCVITPLVYVPVTTVHVSSICVNSKDPRLAVKSENAWEAINDNLENVMFTNEYGDITETGIANIAMYDGNNGWITPPVTSGLLPGTLRQALIEGGLLREKKIPYDTCGEHIMCFNSVRGIFPVKIDK